MSRLVALLIVSLLPGAPLATASCLVACSMETTAGADACHGQQETLWNSSPSVVAGESGCAWVASAPLYVREDRRQPELPMTGAGTGIVRLAPFDINDNVGVRYDPSQPLRVRTSPVVLRL
ncbi:MAG TPA: hypothetical protein VFO67_18595 [Gemmatimonadales bacterium]|nr:hypothetical protein [Gemmatimonadales bacterium]